jgi:two-component system chemotaxis response regulator CheB
MVVIGSSTGGPPALQHLFQSLPFMPIPFVVAQHMPPVFTRLFAERVDRLTRYRVKEAENGEVLMPGVVYVAPGGQQTDVVRNGDQLRIRLTEKSLGDLYAPSVNRLFHSAAACCDDRVLAVILTGMGDDGAEGIKEIHMKGGRTIAESAVTAIIFGMPGEAIKTGSVQKVLPLHEISEAIADVCMGR